MTSTTSPSKARILLIDDHEMVRDGLKRILLQSGLAGECGEASDAARGLRLALHEAWDLIVLDIGLPDRNGLEVLTAILGARPKARVLVVSMFQAKEYGVRSIQAGAAGFISKVRASRELLEAARVVLAGRRYITRELADLTLERGAVSHAPAAQLSGRERQVLAAIGTGKRLAAVAVDLGLNPKTVSTYRARILEKLGLRTTQELIRYAMEQGITAGKARLHRSVA